MKRKVITTSFLGTQPMLVTLSNEEIYDMRVESLAYVRETNDFITDIQFEASEEQWSRIMEIIEKINITAKFQAVIYEEDMVQTALTKIKERKLNKEE